MAVAGVFFGSGIRSGYTESHSYTVRAINGTCYTNSEAQDLRRRYARFRRRFATGAGYNLDGLPRRASPGMDSGTCRGHLYRLQGKRKERFRGFWIFQRILQYQKRGSKHEPRCLIGTTRFRSRKMLLLSDHRSQRRGEGTAGLATGGERAGRFDRADAR